MSGVQRSTRPAARPVLELIDRMASEWLEAALPIEFRRADEHELDEVYRLRYRTIVEQGWARPRDLAGERERDEYDEWAVHIVGMDAGTLAATSRVVLPLADRLLPTEAAFELTTPVPPGAVDLGRMVVAADYRSSRHRIFAALLGRSWLEARSHGFSGIVGDASRAVIARYEELGIRVTRLGPAQAYWGEERLPIAMDAEATAIAATGY